jgi:hypothetical protein
MDDSLKTLNYQSGSLHVVSHRLPAFSPASSVLVAATLLACCVMALCSLTVAAFAHHPGSHAWRKPAQSGLVRLEAVALVQDGCTFMGSIVPGAPEGQAAGADAFGVTIQLRRAADVVTCPAQAKALRDEVEISVPASFKRLHLFVLRPDGTLAATERVTVN